jgi:hypothetical protein
LVIFCVALVEAMRLRRSFRLGMGDSVLHRHPATARAR